MKLSELRIGNWVQDSIGNYYQATVNTIEALFESEKRNWICPITLTPEILEKCGFNKYQWMDGYFIKTKFGDFMIQFYKSRTISFFTKVSYKNDGMSMKGRKFVNGHNFTQDITQLHILQNFIFVLTGEELEFKP